MKKKRCFAFIIHPREIEDVYRRLGNIMGMSEKAGMRYLPKVLSKNLVKSAIRNLRWRPGFTICSRFDVNEEVEGYIIAVLLTGEQMITLPRHKVFNRVMDAILFAQKLGVERIGLGAYTSPMTFNGIKVVGDRRIKCNITHGDALASASAIEAIKKVAKIKRIDVTNSTIAVVGAYGIVGRGVALIASSDLNPASMILTGPNVSKLKKVKGEVTRNYQGGIYISSDNSDIVDADIVVLATTANGSVVTPRILKENAVVVDMAQPYNMDGEVCDRRPDVTRIDGGYMSIAPINLGFKMGPPADTTFACLTETMASTIIGDRENHVGDIDVDFAKRICTEAEKIGFALAPLTNFSKPVHVAEGSAVVERKRELVKVY